LTGIILFVACFQGCLTSNFVLEACARAEALQYSLDLYKVSAQARLSIANADDDAARHRNTRAALPLNYAVEVRHRQFELSVLNTIFLGPGLSRFFTLTTALDLYGITWAFCSIFASTMAEECSMHETAMDYEFYVGIFALVAIPLSCTSILDQLYLQMAFLSARLFMVTMMIGTLAGAFYNADQVHFGDQVGPSNHAPVLASWPAAIQTIQTSIFATAFQFSVPAIAGVSRNKKVLGHIFEAAVGFIFCTNLLLGILVSIYFGDQTNPSSNLNWVNYHGGGGMAPKVVSYYIVLFAAIDGVAIYPLVAGTLGDILLGAWYGERGHDAKKNWKIRVAFRLLASVPQSVGALFVRDLGVIALYAGIFTVLSYTVCPALLSLTSQTQMEREGYPTCSRYTQAYLSSRVSAYIVIVGSVLVMAAVILDAILG
jgi:hypothetical protein